MGYIHPDVLRLSYPSAPSYIYTHKRTTWLHMLTRSYISDYRVNYYKTFCAGIHSA